MTLILIICAVITVLAAIGAVVFAVLAVRAAYRLEALSPIDPPLAQEYPRGATYNDTKSTQGMAQEEKP
jgi:hypothetical protein